MVRVGATVLCLSYIALSKANASVVMSQADEDLMYKGDIWQGDILASYDQLQQDFGTEVADEAASHGLLTNEGDFRLLGAATPGFNGLWRGGKLYYAPLAAPFTGSMRTLVIEAMADITSTTGITFHEQAHSNGYVSFVGDGTATGCSSRVGHTGQRGQALRLKQPGNGGHCMFKGIVIHELLHALGFYHEHSNNDRDNFVTILFDKINSDFEHNFDKRPDTRSLGVPYDIGGIMHYRASSFPITPGEITIVPKPGVDGSNMGQRTRLAVSDQLQLQLYYHCTIENPTQNPDNNVYGPKSLDRSGANKLCSTTCPCNEGQGHCSSDNDCKGNLVCNQNVGVYSYRLTSPFSAPGLNVCGDAPASKSPTRSPTKFPTNSPTASPTKSPSKLVTKSPSLSPTNFPTLSPTHFPTKSPTRFPTKSPSVFPTKSPTSYPTNSPSRSSSVPTPTASPSAFSETKSPTTSDEAAEVAVNGIGGNEKEEEEMTKMIAYSIAGGCGAIALVAVGVVARRKMIGESSKLAVADALEAGYPVAKEYGDSGYPAGAYRGGKGDMTSYNPRFGK